MTLATDEEISPTPERFRQGDLERVETIVTDDQGYAVATTMPLKAVGILMSLFKRGAITATQAHAGAYFRIKFRKAALDQLMAADIERPKVSGRHRTPILPSAIENARESVTKAVNAAGGRASLCGSCLWDIIGMEMTIKDWCGLQAGRKKPMSQHQATGVLIAALEILEKHYGL